jgi:hypothetical protein
MGAGGDTIKEVQQDIGYRSEDDPPLLSTNDDTKYAAATQATLTF